VLDEQNGLLGIVTLDDIREEMFNPELYETKTVHHFMRDPLGIVQITDGMELVVEKFKLTGAWNLAVMDGDKYVGFISKSKLFTSYRSMLVKFSDD
jgi:CIC family chloride channel protein